jgi:EmrB/QacA subfamily drug resistance transporter
MTQETTGLDSTALTMHPAAIHDPSHTRRWWTLAVIGVAQLMVILDTTIVNIALPSAQQDLAFSTANRQWIVTAYALAFGGLLLIAGRLSDLLDRKWTFVGGLVGFAAASVVGGAANGFVMLVTARAVQGAFGALLVATAVSILQETFTDPGERGKAFGIYATIAGGGGALGLLLGGVLTQYASWRWCLYVNVPLAAVALAGALVLIRSHVRSRGGSLDIPGSIISAAGLAAIVYGFSEASTAGWSDPKCYGCIAGGVFLLLVFLGVKARLENPLVPLAILRDRTRGASYLGMTVAGIAVTGMFLIMTYYFQGTLHFSPTKAGLAFLPVTVGFIVGANVAGNTLLAKLGPKVVVPVGMTVAAGAMGWLTQIDQHTHYCDIVTPIALLGIGLGTVMVPSLSLAVAGARPQDAGVASGLVNAANQIGGSLGASLMNTVAITTTARYFTSRAGRPGVASAAGVHGDVAALTVGVIILAASILVTGVLFPRHETRTPSDDEDLVV